MSMQPLLERHRVLSHGINLTIIVIKFTLFSLIPLNTLQDSQPFSVVECKLIIPKVQIFWDILKPIRTQLSTKAENLTAVRSVASVDELQTFTCQVGKLVFVMCFTNLVMYERVGSHC